MNKLNLIGKEFGRLVVIGQSKTKKEKTMWLCRCECGNTLEVIGSNLKSGTTKSCGCLQQNRTSEARFKHGLVGTPEYGAWVNMKTRCYNANSEDYPDYGGRGIIVCERWLGESGFINFLSDIGNKPTKNHSVDRINTNGNYTPLNCRWGTDKQQVRNKRNNVWIEYCDKNMILSDWARYFGVDQGNLSQSIRAKGFPAVYNFYLSKHGVLPAPNRYLAPCHSKRKRYENSIEFQTNY